MIVVRFFFYINEIVIDVNNNKREKYGRYCLYAYGHCVLESLMNRNLSSHLLSYLL